MKRCSDHYAPGTALVVCLMVLAILTLLGATAILNTGMETKITHNTRKSEEAFYAAEAGIEHFLSLQEPKELDDFHEIVSDALDKGDSSSGPRYRVTLLDAVPLNWGVTVFTIESIGYARNEQARRVLRSSVQVVTDHSTYDNPGTYRDYSNSDPADNSAEG